MTKHNLTIKSVDGTAELTVKSIVFSEDGKSAVVTMLNNFADATQYNVSCNYGEQPFTASVGAVASITIFTTTAEQGVTTPIEYALYDASNIDVTPAVSVDTNVYVTVTGDYSSIDDKASAPKITMLNVGDKADVTVTYSTNTKDDPGVSKTATITCVDAKAVQGNMLFAVTTDINDKSQCAKFYQGLSDTTAKITVDDTKTIYFCAKDGNDVIKYDSYEVESSNDNIVNAFVDSSAGKYVKINATGNIVGKATINVKASKNGKVTNYTIPVETYQAGVPVRMTLTPSSTTMSDSKDTDYKELVTAQLLDAAGDPVKGDFSAKVIEKTAANVTPIKLVDSAGTDLERLDSVTEAKFWVTANGATKGDYTIEVTGADDKHYTNAITRRVNITVKELPEYLQNITYDIEIVDQDGERKSAFDMIKTDERAFTARLYAKCNGLFAGYVDMAKMQGNNAPDSEIGGHKVATGEAIKTVTMGAIFGTLKFGDNSGSLVTKGAFVNVAAQASQKAEIDFKTVDDNGDKIIDTKDIDGETAKLGNYTIKFELLRTADNAKAQSRTTTVAVQRSYKDPTVTVLSKKTDNIGNTDIIIADCLETNVDMNNDVSGYESIAELYDKDYAPLNGKDKDGKLFAKYAQVEDNIGDETWQFYYPINTTFTQK